MNKFYVYKIKVFIEPDIFDIYLTDNKNNQLIISSDFYKFGKNGETIYYSFYKNFDYILTDNVSIICNKYDNDKKKYVRYYPDNLQIFIDQSKYLLDCHKSEKYL